jgi:multiple sugar transport system substrate-binding protein
MSKKIWATTTFILFVVLALTACSGGATPTVEQALEEGNVPDAAEQVTLSIWAFEGESEFFDGLIAAFEEKYPDVNVEVTDIPEDEYTTKIDTALIAGEPPDIGFIYEPKWVAAGHFLPLDETLRKFNISVDDYNPGAMAQNCLYGEEVYCLGTYTGAIMLFYNKDIFDAAGVPYPSTTTPMSMDEYVAMAQAVTKKSETLEENIWGSDADIGIWWQDWQNFIGEEGRKVEGYTNDESTVHAFEKLAEIRRDGTVISGADAGSLEGVDLLATGQLATSIVDNVIAIPMLENSGFRWGAAIVPVEKKGDEPWTTTWTDGFGVFSKSKHPVEAANFVAFMGMEGNEMRLENGDFPLNMSLASQWAGDSEGRQEAVKVLELARATIFVPGYWDVTSPLWDAFYGDILEDGRDVQEVLDEYAPIMQETLDQAWETWESFLE